MRTVVERIDDIGMDVVLPVSVDGFAVWARIRKELRQAMPALILTARDSVENKLVGFDGGADDYLMKSFSVIELDPRVKPPVRRAIGAHASQRFIAGELIFDLSTFELTRADTQLGLTPTGYKLLPCLIRAAPNVVTGE